MCAMVQKQKLHVATRIEVMQHEEVWHEEHEHEEVWHEEHEHVLFIFFCECH